MKNILFLFLFLVPVFLFAQYPTQGNKSRLGYQTTGDGLIWRGVAADTSYKPIGLNYPYFQLDTVNGILRRYIRTRGRWQEIGGGTDIDSLIYATRFWVNSNFFPLQGGTLTGTGGAGFIGFPSQVSAPGTPASGLNVYAQGSSFNWKGTDGYERQFASTLTGGRTYTLPNVSGTFALGTGTANLVPLWTATNTLGSSNIQDNGTAVSILNSKPFALGQWTTAGRPTGTDGYKGRNTTTGFEEGYFTSQWENYITSIGATTNQLAIFSSAGKIAGYAKLDYSSSQLRSASTATTGFNPVFQVRAPSGLATNSNYGITYNVAGNGAKAAIMFNGNNSGGVADIDFYTTNDFAAGTDGIFFSNNLNRLRIARNGQILIGTTTSTFGDRVEINGDISNSTFRTISGTIFRMRANSSTVRFVGPGWGAGARFVINAGSSDFNGFAQIGSIPNIDFNNTGSVTSDFIPGAKTSNSPLYLTWNTNGTTTFTQQRFHKFDTLGLAIGGTSVIRPLTVTGAARITGSVGTATTIVGRDGNGDISILGLGTNLSISGGILNAASGTDTHFANANLTATGNRTHDWANYNFTWTNMKKLMWGSDSLFKITKEFSGYTYAVMRAPSGQALLDLQGNAGSASNSAELRLTDNSSGRIVFINHDRRGFGSNGYRMEHYNGSNYHNMLFVDETSRLFHINQGGYSSGTFQDGDAAILSGVSKNISRDAVGTFNTDTIMAVHYFRAKNNLTKNRDVFGIYGQGVAIDTMYTRFDKTGRLFQYKDAFFTRNVSFTRYGVGNKEAADLSKTQSNYIAGFATDGTVLDLNVDTLLKKEKYFTITSTSSPQTLSNNFSDNLINQGGTQATFTLKFPASPVDGQVLKITYNNAITTLTLDGNGNTIVGSAVTTGVAGSQRAFKFYTGIGWIKLY